MAILAGTNRKTLLNARKGTASGIFKMDGSSRGGEQDQRLDGRLLVPAFRIRAAGRRTRRANGRSISSDVYANVATTEGSATLLAGHDKQRRTSEYRGRGWKSGKFVRDVVTRRCI